MSTYSDDKYFSLKKCNCGPFFFPKFVNCWFSKKLNYQCYIHDIAYREQRRSRYQIDKDFLNAMLDTEKCSLGIIYFYYYFVKLTSWFSWYLIKIDNHMGFTQWGKKVKKDGYIYEKERSYKTPR